MLTTHGKNILAKKLSGVTDSCFDYLSIGIGTRPSPSIATTGVHQSGPLMAMNHEVLRVPVVSALPTNTGTIKCVAEIPSAFTCEFTEVGLWTHRENAGSGRPQSQQVVSFQPSEEWLNGLTGAAISSTIESAPADADYTQHNAAITAGGPKAFIVRSDDLIWTSRLERRARKEGFRLGTHGMIVRGDLSAFTGLEPNAGTAYIKLPVNGYPFDASSVIDELSLAYFLSTNSQSSTTPPTSIKMSVQFVTNDSKVAKWNVERKNQTADSFTWNTGYPTASYTPASTILRRGDMLTGSGLLYATSVYPNGPYGAVYLSTIPTSSGSWSVNAFDIAASSTGNAYYTDYTQLSEAATSRSTITYDAGFKWANVTEVRIYVGVNDASPTNYWVGLDSLRFTNTDTSNPTYGLVAYDIAFNYETRGIQTRTNSPTNVLFEVSVV